MKMKKTPDWESVPTLTGKGTAILEVPLGETIHNIIIRLIGDDPGDFTRDHIPRVRLKINGKAFWKDIPATVIHADNMSKGSVSNNVFLLLDFEEPRARAFSDQILTAIGTAQGVNSFKVELDIEGATAPRLESWYSCVADGRALGPLPCMYMETYEIASLGVKTPRPGYGREYGHVWRRVHWATFNEAGAAISPATQLKYLSLTKNSLPYIDKLTDEVNRYYQAHYEDVPQENIMTVDFVQDNNATVNLFPTGDGLVLWEIEAIAKGKALIYYSVIADFDKI